MEKINSVPTSLQNILFDYSKQYGQKKVSELFEKKQYPKFQLLQFYHHDLFAQHEKFRFFTDILEEWNRKIDKNELPSFSDTLYQKNIFIYDTLKNSILHNHQNANKILSHLFEWFNKTRNTTVRMLPKKKKEACVPFDEQWEIRNTFKSNLPSQISLYRRRLFWNYQPNEKQKALSTKGFNTYGRKVKTEGKAEETNRINSEVQDKRIVRIENQLIRAEIERKELANIHKQWNIKKQRECQSSLKNYYSGDFSTNKLYFPKKEIISQEKDTTMVIEKRVKTSLGIRSIGKKLSSCNRYSQNDAHLKLIPRKMIDTQKETQFEEFDLNKQIQFNSKIGPSLIDGMRLFANPFQKKLKKKKRVN